MHSEVDLCSDLKRFLQEVLKERNALAPEKQLDPPLGSLKLHEALAQSEVPDKPEEFPKFNIFVGFLPSPDEAASLGDCVPFVSILPQRLQVGDLSTRMQINLDLCVYAEGEELYRDAMNLIHQLYFSLKTLPNMTLNERYNLIGDLVCEFDPEDYRPYLHAVIETVWEFPAPFSHTDNLEF